MFISHDMANIFLVSHILLSAKYEKLGKYRSYCTRNRAITNAYQRQSTIQESGEDGRIKS